MKNKETTVFILSVIFGIFLIVLVHFYAKNQQVNYSSTEIKCLVTHVDFHPMQSISVAQLDPIWTANTDCGFAFTSRYKVNIGDTIKLIKLKKIENGK
jgi:hypothetical protein